MKWIVLVSLILVTGCNEKRIVQNENNQKVDVGIKEETDSNPESSSLDVEPTIPVSESLEDGSIKNTPVITKEEQAMQQIDSLEQEITTLLASEKIESAKETIATKFIMLVDFIYYEQPIGNLYFKDLTASAQEKVCAVLARMDQAIENKLPGYKDTLKEKYQIVLQYVKTEAANLTHKISEKLESTMGSDNYQNFVEAKDDMVEAFQNTAGMIQEGASHVYQSGKEKVSNWYQGLKEKYEK